MNGQIINLKTKEIRVRNQEDYLVVYNPNTQSQIVKQFLNNITLNDSELKDFL
jgi:hypothetical protein